VKPPFRWVGGKTKLLPHIEPFLPREAWGEYTNIRRYFEPMMGGGALYWHYGDVAEQCFLNDINFPLMNTYAMLRSCFDDVRTAAMRFDDLSYNELRQRFNQHKAPGGGYDSDLAAMFCMLMGTCFNGVYRENRKGGFNCPQGGDSKGNRHEWSRVDWEGLQKAGARLHQSLATISYGSIFPWPWPEARPGLGDLVFYDPPYFGEFSDYDASRFGELQHRQLYQQAQEWAERGATVIVCGSNNDWSWGIYGKPTTVIPVRRTVGNSLRGDATEALYVYGA